DRRSNASSRPRSHGLSPPVGLVPVLQGVPPVVTIIVLFPLTGPGTRRGGGLSESRSGNERGQGQDGEKHLHDTSPCHGPSSDDCAVITQPALAVAHRVRKVDRGRQCLFPDSVTWNAYRLSRKAPQNGILAEDEAVNRCTAGFRSA